PTFGLRDIHPSHWVESVGLGTELLVHSPDHLPFLSTGYYRLNRLPINARYPLVSLDLLPRLPEDILTPYLVIQRIKFNLLSLLGLGIEGPLQLPVFSAKYPPAHAPGKGPQSLVGAPPPGDVRGRSGR